MIIWQLLEGMTGPQTRRFIERSGDNLDSYRHSIAIETCRDRQRREPGDIENEGGPRNNIRPGITSVSNDREHVIQTWRHRDRPWGDQDVNLLERRLEVLLDDASGPQSLEVIGGANE